MDLQKVYTDDDFKNSSVPDGQLLVFTATENGKPVTRYKDSSGVFGTLSGDSGGGDTPPVVSGCDFYQCAAVHGPKKVSGFIVSGAGTAAVNGNYVKTDLTTEEGGPIYKHETAEYYYFEMWGEKGICTSPTIYPSEGLYYNMSDEGWYVGNGGTEPAPEVTEGNITVNANVPKTWDGYKAVWSNKEGYFFEATLTDGLAYGSALIPAIGGVYDSEARVEVSKLFEAVKPITTNDSSCVIYIDGTALTNQGKAPNKQDITFGSGVSSNGTLLLTPDDGSGRITTYSKTGGYGGLSNDWVLDICAKSEAYHCYLTGNSNYGWCIQSNYGKAWEFRGGPVLMPRDSDYSKLFCISVQYSDGFVHVWNAGKYVGATAYTITPVTEVEFGIGTDGDPNGNMANSIKLFRFSNKARYVPGQDFELPEGFI